MASGNFKVTIKLNPINQILKRHGLQQDGEVNIFLRNEVERYSDSYIPFLKSTLKNNKSHPNSHSIKYNSPYARYNIAVLQNVVLFGINVCGMIEEKKYVIIWRCL